MRARNPRRTMRNRRGRKLRLVSEENVEEYTYNSDKALTPKSIPKNVKKLHIVNYNHPIYSNVLPHNLSELHLEAPFDQPLRNDLPSSIVSLYLGDQFTQELKPGDLPDMLENLYFGSRHSQNFLPGIIPDSVKVIHFGDGMDGDLPPGSIPGNIREIVFGKQYNQHLYTGMFPESLEVLEFGRDFDKKIMRGDLPEGLKTLRLHTNRNIEIEDGALPENIETISITSVTFDRFDKLPKNLKSLMIGEDYIRPITNLPENLEELSLETYLHPFTRSMFPKNLKKLYISEVDSWKIGMLRSGILPNALKELVLGYKFRSLIESLPQTLETLIFKFKYYHYKDFDPSILPRNLKYLDLGPEFDHEIPAGSLPDGLEELVLPQTYSQSAVLPASVKKTIPENLMVLSEIRSTWMRFKDMVRELVSKKKTQSFNTESDIGEDKVIAELERMYQMGYPIPVEPHPDSLLKTDGLDHHEMEVVSRFVFIRLHHVKYLEQLNRDGRMKTLINNWIYGNYSWFNSTVGDINMSVPYTYENKKFLGEYENTSQAHHAFHNAIMMSPRVDHKVYAWRGMHGMEELCMNARVGTYVKFSRFMACSVAQEVSCQTFARDGILLLVELPPNTPFLNLTPLKKSEPEFLLPDRCMFRVVRRIRFEAMKQFCGHSCEEIVHLKLVGVYDYSWEDFEMYLGDDDLTEDVKDSMNEGILY